MLSDKIKNSVQQFQISHELCLLSGSAFLILGIFLRAHCQVSLIVCVPNTAKTMHALLAVAQTVRDIPWTNLNALIFEPESFVALDDAAHGRLGEMCRTNHHVAVAITLQKTPPRGS